MNAMLKEGSLEKTYWAVVQKAPPESTGHLVHFMTRNEKQNKTYLKDTETPGAKVAELYYTLIGQSERHFLLEVRLVTGRHHQIRAQLASIGCPIRGDLKYGAPRSNPDGSIHLHAQRIVFEHPVRATVISKEAPSPDEKIWNLFRKTTTKSA
jgi:23S rRNA pseudouridine1911/1915/1917 synthase